MSPHDYKWVKKSEINERRQENLRCLWEHLDNLEQFAILGAVRDAAHVDRILDMVYSSSALEIEEEMVKGAFEEVTNATKLPYDVIETITNYLIRSGQVISYPQLDKI
jgi:hypothetical protein